MIGFTFPCKHVGKEKGGEYLTDLYSFKCLFNQAYIVEVEHHTHNIFIVKFYQKNHRDSKYRYMLLNNPVLGKRRDAAKNFLMILNTITDLIVDTYSHNSKASFGFMGAPTKEEIGLKKRKKGKVLKKKNSDGTVPLTKRFHTYSRYVKRYFSPQKFEHIEIKSSSCYMLKSKENITLTRNRVEHFFSYYLSYYA